MTPYKNLSGNSSVVAYEIGEDSITVWYEDSPKAFRFSYEGRAGRKHVDDMIRLAEAGDGLSTYINYNFRFDYD